MEQRFWPGAEPPWLTAGWPRAKLASGLQRRGDGASASSRRWALVVVVVVVEKEVTHAKLDPALDRVRWHGDDADLALGLLGSQSGSARSPPGPALERPQP
ncbi:MAG: hypothetical protein ACK40D_03085, partial [Cyanobacteriota bacterium]